MANMGQVDQLRYGAGNWNLWRNLHPNETPDLSNYDFAANGFKDFRRYNLSYANLRGSNLSGIDLGWKSMEPPVIIGSGPTISGANLSDVAGLVGADPKHPSGGSLVPVDQADLTGADLTGADLSNARLSAVSLAGANLSNAKLCKAQIDYAEFSISSAFSLPAGIDLTGGIDLSLPKPANVNQTDFKEAIANSATNFKDVDTSVALNFDTIIYY